MTITEPLLDYVFNESVVGGPPPVDAESGDATITEGFDYVFAESGSGGTASQTPFPWPVAVGGRPFVIDLAHYAYEIPDMVRQAIDFSARPGEQSFDTGGVWLRTSGDWSLGAGQPYLDAAQASERRFFSSIGIDPWLRRVLRLLPATEQPPEFASASLKLRLLPLGVYLYFMDGAGRTLGRTTAPQSASPALTPITGGPAADLNDLTTDGTHIFIATASGIYKHNVTSTTMAVYGGAASTTIADIIEYANGFLLIGQAGVLSSVSAAGAVTPVYTHLNDAFVWSTITGTPGFIYAGGQGADRAEIFRIGIDQATGGLAPPIQSGELPRGEQLRTMAYYGGALLLGTSKGFRLAMISGGGDLLVGPLVPTPGSEVRCVWGEAEFVWFGWTGYDSTHTGLGRARLSEFTSDGKAAYASDLMAENITGTVVDVVRFAGHTYFAVAGSGYWREKSNGATVVSGTIDLGNVEWGTFEPKTFLGCELITEPLQGKITVALTDDTGDVRVLGAHDNQGSTGLGKTIGAGLGNLSTFYRLTLTLSRSTDPTLDPSTTPVLRLLTARGLIVPRQVQRFTLPVICKSKVQGGPGSEVELAQDVAAVREYFVTLRRSAKAVLYQEGEAQHLVIVRRVWMDPGMAEHWAENRDGIQGTLMVQLDSAEP